MKSKILRVIKEEWNFDDKGYKIGVKHIMNDGSISFNGQWELSNLEYLMVQIQKAPKMFSFPFRVFRLMRIAVPILFFSSLTEFPEGCILDQPQKS
jgi:hypothetical protein